MKYFIEVFLKLLEGAKITGIIFIITLIFSIPLGLIGAGLKRINFKLIKVILDCYTWVIRGTPLLLQLYFAVYGLPIIIKNITGNVVRFDELTVACVTFIVNYTAYFIEIFRGGMNSIGKGQFEACKVLRLNNYQSYFYVILPQTFKRTIPSITNEAITLVKDTALVASVAIFDILNTTKRIVSLDFRFEAYFMAAIMYLGMSYLIVGIFRKIEKRYSFYN